ncbi:MAG TPA: hypothetical protein VJX67_15215, partial [Blastocatellia bacterium]|nr:hypothetical protein [Blastocatellia bacterium]
NGAPAASQTSSPENAGATSPATQYLFFQIFTYPLLPAAYTPGQIDPVAQSIVNAVGMTGDKHRKLGLTVGPLTLDDSNAGLIQIIDDSFAVAEKYNVAIMFHLDDSMFWLNRPDLWSQHQNVEWTSWSGAEAGPRMLPWYTGPLAPQMCYNSSGIKDVISTLVGQIIGPEIQKNLAQLKAHGKSNLFAGIITGWETMLPDTNPPAGYNALTNLGYSAANPPADMDTARVGVVHDFIQFWDQQFVAAGIDPGKLHTHLATFPLGAANSHAPLVAAFNPFSHAGFTAYGSSGESFPQIYEAVAAENANQWGVSEGSNIYPPSALPGHSGLPDLPMDQYLAQAYNHGATYVNLLGWQATGTAFYIVLTDPAAIRAYRRFLKGKRL